MFGSEINIADLIIKEPLAKELMVKLGEDLFISHIGINIINRGLEAAKILKKIEEADNE